MPNPRLGLPGATNLVPRNEITGLRDRHSVPNPHVNSNPESQRVSGPIFGLGKKPSELGRDLSDQRESHREQKRPKNAGICARVGTKFPVWGVNSKARYFAVEISAP